MPLPVDRLVLVASIACYLGSRGGAERLVDLLRRQMLRVAVFVLLGGWAVASALAVGTLFERDSAFALADRLLVPLLLFLYTPLVVRSARDVRLLLAGLTCFGAYLGFTAVMAAVGPAAGVFPRYINDASLGLAFGRARGPSIEAVGTGVNLLVFGAAAGLLAAHQRGPRRALAVLVAALCFTGAFLTYTRSVWLGALLCVVLAAVKFARFRTGILGSAAGVAVLVAGTLLLVPGVLSSATGRASFARSVLDRQYTNEAALRMVGDHPLTGVGWGRFLDRVTSYVWQYDLVPITNVRIEAHNIFLSRAAELGIPGLILLVICVASGPVYVMFARQATDRLTSEVQLLAVVAACAWFAAAMLTPMSYPLPNAMAWGLAGLAIVRRADGALRDEAGPRLTFRAA